MALYVIKKCPNCKNVYETDQDRRGIGIPFLTCKFCKTIIIDEDDTEWELKDWGQKISYILICGWTAILYGLLVPLIVLGINEIYNLKTSDKQFLLFYLLGFVLFVIIIFIRNLKEIRKSKERMKDVRYRNLLKQLGLLK